jgi:hypothetical protein
MNRICCIEEARGEVDKQPYQASESKQGQPSNQLMFIFFFINGAYDDTKISSSKNIYIPVDMGFVGILTQGKE